MTDDDRSVGGKPTAVGRALTSLEAQVRRQSGMGEPRLPTVRALAAEAEVSRSTMAAAVQDLKARGLLLTRQGGHILVASLAAQGIGRPVARQPVYMRLAERIGADIVQGRYVPGQSLGSGKVLSAQYGVNRRTLAKALSELRRQRMLEATGRSHRLAGPQARPGFGTLWLVTTTDDGGGVATSGPRTEHLVASLDRHCGQAGCRMQVLAYDRQLSRFRSPEVWHGLAGNASGPAVLGFAVLDNLNWGGTPGAATNLARALKQLLPLRRPVALIDESGGAAPPESQRVRWFRTSSRTAGAVAGRLLLGRGHRRVAFLSAVHGAAWSQQRFEGLVSVFAAAGLRDGVVPFVHTRASAPRDYQVHEFDFTGHRRQLLRPLLRDDRDHPDSLVARTLMELSPSLLLLPREHVVLQRPVRGLAAAALACEGVTAWVAAHDVEALICQDFLAERRVRVPDRVSLVSFDNTPEAFTRGVTSYDFNVDALARAAVSHVLGLPVMPGRSGSPPVDIEGWFVERGSSRPLRPGA